jgi:hypothetical protein
MTHRTDDEIAPELREAVTQFLTPLQTMQPTDVAAFKRLHTLVVELMRSCKGSDRVSKSLLHELYSVPRVISAEIAHRPTERHVLEEMSQDLEFCFDQLLLGEVPEDRKPGAPRIM